MNKKKLKAAQLLADALCMILACEGNDEAYRAADECRAALGDTRNATESFGLITKAYEATSTKD